MKRSGATVTRFGRHARATAATMRTLSRAMGMLGIGVGIGAMIAGIKKIVTLTAQQETAERGLDAALRAAGDSIDEYGQKLRDTATYIQQITVYGDEQVLSMMAQARNLGIVADKLEETTKGAIGLSVALKMDANTAMRYTALAMQGEYTMLRRYLPALRQVTTQSEQLAIVQTTMARGFRQAIELADTAAGTWSQLGSAWTDVLQKIGAPFLPPAQKQLEYVSLALGGRGMIEKPLALLDAQIMEAYREARERQARERAEFAQNIGVAGAVTEFEFPDVSSAKLAVAYWESANVALGEANERYKALQSSARAFIKLTETPMERFTALADLLSTAFREGAITAAEFHRGAEAALSQLQRAQIGRGPGEFRIVKSATMDVTGLGGGRVDPMLKKADEQKTELVGIGKTLKEIKGQKRGLN